MTAEVRVSNQSKTTVRLTSFALVSGRDDVPLDYGARDAAAPLMRSIAAGHSATGSLHFTTTTAVTQRLLTTDAAHLQIAGQLVKMKLETMPAAITSGGAVNAESSPATPR